MNEMSRKQFIKILGFGMVSVAMQGIPVYAAQPTKMLGGVTIVSESNTDCTSSISYYITDGDQKAFYKENLILNNDVISVTTNIYNVDTNGNPIESSKKTETQIVKCKSIDFTDKATLERATNEGWREHTETISLAGAKKTVQSIQALIVAATGMGMGAAESVATNLLDRMISELMNNVPDEVYFKGERMTSHSVGKIYYRYSGGIYLDKAYKKLIKGNLSWSRRWGH